jgi:hypothetical protein
MIDLQMVYTSADDLTNHALSCDVCYKWASSGNYGNEPACRTGQEIRENLRQIHAELYKL